MGNENERVITSTDDLYTYARQLLPNRTDLEIGASLTGSQVKLSHGQPLTTQFVRFELNTLLFEDGKAEAREEDAEQREKTPPSIRRGRTGVELGEDLLENILRQDGEGED